MSQQPDMMTSNGFYSGAQSGPQPVDPRTVYDFDQLVYSESSNLNTERTWLPRLMQPLVQSSAPNPYSRSGVPNYSVPAAQPLPRYMYLSNSDAPQAQIHGEQIAYELVPGEQYAPHTAAVPQQGDCVLDPHRCGPGAPELSAFMPDTLYEDIPAMEHQALVQAQPQPQGGDPGPSTTVQQSQTSGQQKGKSGKKNRTKKQPQKRAPPPKKQKDKDPWPLEDASKRKRKRKDDIPEEPNPAQSQGGGPGPSTAASRRDRATQPATKKPKASKKPQEPEVEERRPLLKYVNKHLQEYTALKEAVIPEVFLHERDLEEISKIIEFKDVTHIVLKSYRCEQNKIMERAKLTYNIHRPFVTWHFLGRILSKAFFGDAEALRHVTTCIASPREFIVFSTKKDPKKFKDVGETLEVILGWSPGRNCHVDMIEAFCQPAATRLISNLEGMLSEFINEEGLLKEYKHEELERYERTSVALPSLETDGSEWRHVEEILRKRGYGRFRETVKHVKRWRFYHRVYFDEYQDRLIPVKNLLGRLTP